MPHHDDFWKEKLARPPWPSKRFTQEMMANVEQRLITSPKTRSPSYPMWSLAAVLVLVAVLFLPSLFTPDEAGIPPVTTRPVVVVPRDDAEPAEHKLQAGDGGDLATWEAMDTSAYRQADQTLIEFTIALIRRELGAMGGPSVPTDRLWEEVERKRVLDRYEVSSPWIQEVHIEQVEESGDVIDYTLLLTLTDSTQATFEERLRLSIVIDSHLIRDVEIRDGEDSAAKSIESEEPVADAEQELPPKDHTLYLLAEDTEHKVAVYATAMPTPDTYKEMTVFYGDRSRTFEEWTNSSFDAFYPLLWVTDVTGDGENEIVIELIVHHGTGYHGSELHVLDANLEEIPVADPVQAARSALEYTLESNEESRTYTFRMNGDEHTFSYKESDAGYWFEAPYLGNVVEYWVQDAVIYAEVPVQISPGTVPSDTVMQYDYVDGMFAIVDVKLEE
mgnify:FL=1